MSSMDRNLQSHPRFKAKFVRDLKVLYEKNKYDAYIERFKQFKQLNTPDDILVNYYFEALMHKGLYYYVIDYALERLQQGVGEYEDNMSFLLKAMLEEGRYTEVLDFTAHLMNETIPHRFRMFIQEVRYGALEKLNSLQDKRRTHIIDVEEEPVKVDVYLTYTEEQKLAFIGEITKDKKTVHRELMRVIINRVDSNTVKTAIFIYLKVIGDNEPITVKKHTQVLEIVPSELPQLEDTKIGGVVLGEVMMALEGSAPDIMELAQSLIISVMMNIYPIEPPFDDTRLVNGFLNYIHDMVNLPYQDIDDNEVITWINHHFET